MNHHGWTWPDRLLAVLFWSAVAAVYGTAFWMAFLGATHQR